MKKFLISIFVILLGVLFSLLLLGQKKSTNPSTILIEDTPLTLTQVHAEGDKFINTYTDIQGETPIQAQVSQYPQPAGFSLQTAVEEIQKKYQYIPDDSFNLTHNLQGKTPNITFAFANKRGTFFLCAPVLAAR